MNGSKMSGGSDIKYRWRHHQFSFLCDDTWGLATHTPSAALLGNPSCLKRSNTVTLWPRSKLAWSHFWFGLFQLTLSNHWETSEHLRRNGGPTPHLDYPYMTNSFLNIRRYIGKRPEEATGWRGHSLYCCQVAPNIRFAAARGCSQSFLNTLIASASHSVKSEPKGPILHRPRWSLSTQFQKPCAERPWLVRLKGTIYMATSKA